MADCQIPWGPPRLRHEALVYSSQEEFLSAMVPFARDGLAHGERVLAATTRVNVAALRLELDPELPGIEFHDQGAWYRSPARAVAAIRRFIDAGTDGAVRVICEPLWPGRSRAALREWMRYEALLNLLFAGAEAWIVCSYDERTTPAPVLARALCTHPGIVSVRFRDPASVCLDLDRLDLEEPSLPFVELSVGDNRLQELRALVARRATLAGLDAERVHDLVMAVNEVATNVVVHAGGTGRLRVWSDLETVVCEISDAGPGFLDHLRGWREPDPEGTSGFGLWIARHLCDLVEMRSGRSGTTTRLHMALGMREGPVRS